MSRLLRAIEAHDLAAVRDELAGGADASTRMSEYPHYTALQSAINELEDGGPLAILEALLAAGARLEDPGAPPDAATPLLMALFRGQPAVVRSLLAAGAEVNTRGGEGDSPLRWVASTGDLDMARELLARGAARTIDDFGEPGGTTALGIATRRRDPAMIELLLAAGADPEAL